LKACFILSKTLYELKYQPQVGDDKKLTEK
jgi:hypothetical protein